jgi:mannitol-1-phosphate 5-dehydrogenase
MRRVVIVGTGRIASGQLAPLFAEAGWEVVLAALAPRVVARIAAAGHFDVRTTGEAPASRVHAQAVLLGSEAFDRAVADAELVTTAVGEDAGPALGAPPARALAAHGPGRPVDVWAVADVDVAGAVDDAVRNAAAAIQAELPPVGFAGAVTYAAVTQGDWTAPGRPVFVAGAGGRLRVDARRLVRPLPDLPGVAATNRYAEHLRDQRFVAGAGHALCAHLGLRRGHRFVHEAIRDQLIFPTVAASLEASRAAIGPAGADAGGTVDAILERYADAGLRDPLLRAAGDPMRQLAPDGPLAGPARLIGEATGRVPAGFAAGIAAALGAVVRRQGAAAVLRDVCGLDPATPLGREILRLHAGWASPAAGAGRFRRDAPCRVPAGLAA